jgi:lambda family phage portal protein
VPAAPNVVDRAVGWLAPRAGLRRMQARLALEQVGRIRQRLYDGAGAGRRTEGWLTTGSDANSEVLAGGPMLRQRARDLVRNNPWAPNVVSRYASFVGGMKPKARVRGGPDPIATAKAAETLWSDWGRCCDADGITNGRGQERLAIRNLATDGAVLALRIPRRNDGTLPAPLQVRLLEVDHLNSARDAVAIPGGGKTMGGIEYDSAGRAVTYHLFKDHPGGTYQASYDSVPVPASEVRYVFDPLRAEQRMGVSWLAPAVTRLADLRLLDEAEIVKKQVEACLALIISTPDPEMLITAKAGEQDPRRDAWGRMIEGFSPGMVAYTAPGEQATVVNPSATGLSYDHYVMQLHAVCAALAMPYELGTGDLSRVSFISGRMGLIPFYLRVDEIRETVTVPQYLDQVWDWMVEAAQVAGALPRDAAITAEWMGPERPSLQPFEEAQAQELRIRTGQEPLSYAHARAGRDSDAVFAEYERVNKLLDDNGLVFDCDPRKTDRRGTGQPVASVPAGENPETPPASPPPAAKPARGLAVVNGNALEH